MRTYYVGMDVHQATIMIVVLNGAGKVVMELVVETGAETVRNFLKSLRGNVSVTFEEGTQAAWLHDVIRPLVSKVIVCDPRRNKLLLEGNKGDRIDALKLAQLLRALSVNTFKRSGAKAAVPEYFRNGHNVGSGSCELRCCGMAKVVKMEILNARQLASFLKGLLDFHPARGLVKTYSP